MRLHGDLLKFLVGLVCHRTVRRQLLWVHRRHIQQVTGPSAQSKFQRCFPLRVMVVFRAEAALRISCRTVTCLRFGFLSTS